MISCTKSQMLLNLRLPISSGHNSFELRPNASETIPEKKLRTASSLTMERRLSFRSPGAVRNSSCSELCRIIAMDGTLTGQNYFIITCTLPTSRI